MTQYRKFAIQAACLTVGLAVLPGVASACGCPMTSRSFTMSHDTKNVYVTSYMTFSHLCQGEVTATITAPDHSTASDDSDFTYSSPVSTMATYVCGVKDGIYSGTGTYYYDGQDVECGSGYYNPMQATDTVAPYLKLTNTTTSKTTLQQDSDSTVFTVSVLASSGCSGITQIANGMSGIANLTGITNTPEGGTPVNNTAYLSKVLVGGNSANYVFTVATAGNNTASGLLTLSAYVNMLPTGCVTQGPDSPNSAGKNVTIQ